MTVISSAYVRVMYGLTLFGNELMYNVAMALTVVRDRSGKVGRNLI